MKTRLNTSLAALLGLFLLSGCATARKVLLVTQEIEMTGSAQIKRINMIVENGRQEDGRYRADKIDIVAPGVQIHATDYSRPLIKKKKKKKEE